MYHSVIEYLRESVLKFPKKIAFKDEENVLTFSELDKLSGAIATELISLEMFEKPVYVISPRNVFTVVAQIGVARAGCYYVPIDPANPIMRIKQIISVINGGLMIVSKEFVSLLEEVGYEGKILILEHIISQKYDEHLVEHRETGINSFMPLYVIFTSGSTGTPKGVVTSHAALMCYIEAVAEVLELTDSDNIASQAPMDYIAAVRDIYLPLRVGATTVIVPSNQFAVPGMLVDTLKKNNITTLCWSAAGLEMCVKSGLLDFEVPQSIRKLLFSGSILSGASLAAWQNVLPNATFINQYGPTEATASCTYYVVKEKAAVDTILPIGKPYNGYKVFLLKDENEVLIPNEIGEICVSGPAIALGYYNNPEDTNKNFVQNPVNKLYREVIYKTGDLGKYNENGNLMFCGRMDRQIKHLGHRIELEEIEAYSRSIQGVQESVSIYDNKKKVLCLVYSGHATKRDISLFYRNNLPAYMVPRKIVQMEMLPKLPNGKINVKQLEREILL